MDLSIFKYWQVTISNACIVFKEMVEHPKLRFIDLWEITFPLGSFSDEVSFQKKEKCCALQDDSHSDT